MILFFHNTATTYRIPLFKQICKKVNVTFVFTKMEIVEKIYNVNRNTICLDEINYKMLSKNPMKQWFMIPALIRSKNVSAVMVPTLDSFSELLQAVYIYYIARKRKKAILFYVEHWDAPNEWKTLLQKLKDFIRNRFTKVITNGADLILVNGIKTRYYLSQLSVDENRIQTIYTVSEMPEYAKYDNIKEKFHINKEKIIVLYFGRIIKRKGLDILLKAYAELDIDAQKKVHLLICGEGEFEEECKVLANSLNIENITWVGSVHPDKRYEYFNQCDIFVLPSYFYHGKAEVWGLTINEAIQCGKVVIGTTAVGAAYELINENNGRMVEANSVKELRRAIEDLLASNIFELAVQEDYKIYQKYNYENSANLLSDILRMYDNC